MFTRNQCLRKLSYKGASVTRVNILVSLPCSECDSHELWPWNFSSLVSTNTRARFVRVFVELALSAFLGYSPSGSRKIASVVICLNRCLASQYTLIILRRLWAKIPMDGSWASSCAKVLSIGTRYRIKSPAKGPILLDHSKNQTFFRMWKLLASGIRFDDVLVGTPTRTLYHRW